MKGNSKTGVCETCEGLGYVLFDDTDDEFEEEITCPECNGRGMVEVAIRNKKGEE